MEKIKLIPIIILILFTGMNTLKAQETDTKLKISGKLLIDQRFLLKNDNDWAWNENRLTLNFDKKITDNSKFYGEVWLRNIGLPNITTSTDLYNKGIIDPYNLEVREAYFQVYGFLSKNLDLKIGRQRIAWGTADKLNPTDNLNPYDLEDILDFGRHRGSDALSFNYYFNSDFSLQGVYIPIFQPANLPVGIFSNTLTSAPDLPQRLTLKEYTDQVNMPRFNLSESSTAGIKFKGFAGGFDFSLSYVWGHDGLPISVYNTFTPVDLTGGISINSQLSFYRTHIFGADLAGSIGDAGIWAEAAAFLPENAVHMTNDFSALYPLSAIPVTQDTLVLEKKPYVRFIVGTDYNFADGSYLNIQYMHGFINERSNDNLNDYFFMRFEKRFFEDKLKIAPLGGGFIVSDWKDIKNNYALVYVPEISYSATDNADITLSTAIFKGKGSNMFAELKDYSMLMLKFIYSF